VAPADAYLDDRHVDLSAIELPVGQRGQRLEEGRRVAAGAPREGVLLDRGDELADRRLGDLPAVDPDPLADVVEMRRGVEADRQSGLPEHRLDHPRRRALPVRAGDLHDRHVTVGVAQFRQQRGRGLGPRPRPVPPEVEEEAGGLVVAHVSGLTGRVMGATDEHGNRIPEETHAPTGSAAPDSRAGGGFSR
jgi:hypothetical protein